MRGWSERSGVVVEEDRLDRGVETLLGVGVVFFTTSIII